MRVGIAAVVLSLVASYLVNIASAGDLVLAENGRSAYQIVVADEASPSTRHAAEELPMFLEQMTGEKLPIVSDQQPAGPSKSSSATMPICVR